MIYFLNNDIPDKKAVPKALQNIFGIGKKNSSKLCKFLGFLKKILVKYLTPEMKNKIIAYVEVNIKNGEELKQVLNKRKEHQIKIKWLQGTTCEISTSEERSTNPYKMLELLKF